MNPREERACTAERVTRTLRTALIVALLAVTSVASAQRDDEILSKADAAQVFGMTKQEWRENLVAVVRTSVGTRAGDALTLKTSAGTVTTLPVYSQTDARPSRLEVTVLMSARFTDARIADLMREVRRQMAPEYAVDGRATRMADGGMRFFFAVSETGHQ